MTGKKPYRLAAVTSHPVQYQAPLFQKLARHPDIDLTVFYGSDASLRGMVDPGFGVPVKWDRPLLNGYRYKILRNWSQGALTGGIFSVVNPGVVAELWRGRFDAVFIHSYATATSLLAYLGAWLSGTPVLLRTESELIRPRPFFSRLAKHLFLRPLFRGTRGFLTIGTDNREFYQNYGAPAGRLFFTPYAVDNEYYQEQGGYWQGRRRATKEELKIPGDLPVILFSGKLTPRKRPLDLLLAYEQVLSQGLRAALVFIGDGPLRGDLEEYSRSHKLTLVRVLGFKNQTELPKYYSMGDIFVMPSDFESWGLVVNEAMVFGMPVIVTDRVAAGRDLCRPENGRIYPAGDIGRLASYLGEMLHERRRSREMGRRSRELIAPWNLEACVQGIAQALAAIAAEKSKQCKGWVSDIP